MVLDALIKSQTGVPLFRFIFSFFQCKRMPRPARQAGWSKTQRALACSLSLCLSLCAIGNLGAVPSLSRTVKTEPGWGFFFLFAFIPLSFSDPSSLPPPTFKIVVAFTPEKGFNSLSLISRHPAGKTLLDIDVDGKRGFSSSLER